MIADDKQRTPTPFEQSKFLIFQKVPKNFSTEVVKSCEDNSDENTQLCGCPDENSWPCLDGNKCVSKGFVCDGDTNCNDGSDESLSTCFNWTCVESFWGCNDGVQCIHKTSICDDNPNCNDYSDEDIDFCMNYVCSVGYSKCASGYQCIEKSDICDGKNDCRDKSDELCDARCLDSSLVRTKSIIRDCHENPSVCVPVEYYCDGVAHCPDASDEAHSVCTCEDWGLKSCYDDGNRYCFNPEWREENMFNASYYKCSSLFNKLVNYQSLRTKNNSGLYNL